MEEDKLSWIASFSAIVNQATTSFLSLPSSFYLSSLCLVLRTKPRDLCMIAKYSYH